MTTGQPILKILVRFTSIRKRQKLFTYYNLCFIMCWQRPGLVHQTISYWQNHARMANSQNVAISGEISSAILNIWCRFIGEKVFEIINSKRRFENWICSDGFSPLGQPRLGFHVGEVPTFTWRFNSLLPIMTPQGEDWVNIGSDNDLLPDGTKPLLELLLTYHQRCTVAFTWEQLHKKCSWT